MTLRPGEADAILFLNSSASYIFEQDALGQWRKTAQLTGPVWCSLVLQGIEHGEFKLESHSWPDLVVGGQQLDIAPLPRECRPAPAEPSTTKPAP